MMSAFQSDVWLIANPGRSRLAWGTASACRRVRDISTHLMWWLSMLLWLGCALGGLAHAGTVTYVYTDPQGTPLAEADASGNVTATFDYAPYGGQALGTPPSGPGYTGHVNDPESGLVYMQARYYDPVVGRFLSVDPVGPALGNAFNFNRYGYANNNPIVNVDPDGREAILDSRNLINGPGHSIVMSPGDHGGNSASRSIPKNTPDSMRQYFVKSDDQSMKEAAVATMDYFGIDHKGITCCGILSHNSYANAQMHPNGQLDIGDLLFSHSFGMIDAILYHEVGVHWGLQFSKGAALDGIYTQAWYMREIQAYDLETNKANSRRFGLTPEEINEERVKRSGYLDHLTPWNRDAVEQGYYKP